MMQHRSNGLLIAPALKVVAESSGRFLITRKFVEGACAYAQAWPGPVAVMAAATPRAEDHLDYMTVCAGEVPFTLKVMPDDELGRRDCIRGAGLVLVTTAERLLPLSRLCTQEGTPAVFITETTLRTRKQIIGAVAANPLRRLRQKLQTQVFEQRLIAELRRAAGVQCNGTPTFEAYRRINPRALLFFDTRVSTSMLASEDAVCAKQRSIASGAPLRLAFSGRLVAIKGAGHLPKVAAELRRLGVRFTLDIFGGGDEEGAVRELVSRLALADVVRLRGVAEFQRQLVPYMTGSVDLFVCCHRQGDPSCTYLETLACATPIVGYGNEALAGLVRHSGVGWISAMDDPRELAGQIALLDKDRASLEAGVARAKAFAAKHTFEATMCRRVEHLLACQEHREILSEAKVA